MAYDRVVDSAELDAGMTATANAIREKTGSTDPIVWDASNGFKTAVEGIVAGGEVTYSEYDDVCFWDYDGTLLYSCTLEEAQKMTELPEPPDHSTDDIPLVFEEWNWTLEEINGLNRKADIGAIYSPADSKTHFTIRLTKTTGLTVTINWGQYATANMLFTFDWGDGVVEEYVHASTGKGSVVHEYAGYGIYHCTVDTGGLSWNPGGTNTTFVSTELVGLGACVTGKLVWEKNCGWGWPSAQGCNLVDATVDQVVYPAKLSGVTGNASVGKYVKHINQPRECTSRCLSSNMYALRRISLPCNVSVLPDYAFAYSEFLKEVRIPAGVTEFQRFLYCGSGALETVDFTGRTSILMRECKECKSLRKIEIPSTVKSISAEAFQNCGALEYYLYSEEPPTMENTSVFNDIHKSAVIHVPAASLEAYQTATNWATYADYMVGDL